MKNTRKYKRKISTTRNNRKTRRVTTGGKAIGSGGFGCVFLPPVKCKKRNKKLESDKYVSKLMTKKHANAEYNTIKKIEKTLREIPNYQRYFLIVDVHKCKPGPLSSQDLIKFDKKCKPLSKHKDITSKNVNDNLQELEELILPDGGVTLDTYYQHMISEENLIYINNQIIDLLRNGVLPMNKLHMYHADLKETNILYNVNTYRLSIIDWGLAFKYTRGKLPSLICNKPFQYNLPFSIILFNSKFDKSYAKFMQRYTGSPPREKWMSDLTNFVYEYIRIHNDWRGEGHFNTIITLWSNVYTDNDPEDMITSYLVNILASFTKNGKFEREKYFQSVFLRNVDVWGTLMCYSPVVEENLYNKREKIATIYDKYLMRTWGEPIDTSMLIEDLRM